jgi:hypothetical protein
LEPGSFYTEPADAPHFALTQDEPATVYITGFGPTDTTTSTPLPIRTSLTLKRDRVVRPYRPLSNACSKATAVADRSRQDTTVSYAYWRRQSGEGCRPETVLGWIEGDLRARSA